MKFPELIIENFLAITEAKINLADRGLVVIQGENHADTSADSNGAGKSSIPDALCWCWFGTTARGVTGDDVVNSEVGKNTRVVSVCVDGHMVYTATRHRKHKSGKNSLTISASDGLKSVDLTKGTDKLTQEVANQIIGSSLEVFSGSIYAGQEQMPDLPAMTDKNLKVLIEEAAGVTVLEGAYQKAREHASLAQKSVDEVKATAKLIFDKTEWIENQIALLRLNEATWLNEQTAKIEIAKIEAAACVPPLRQLAADVAAMQALNLEKQILDCDTKIAAVASENTEFNRLENQVAIASAQQSSALRLAIGAGKLLADAKLNRANIEHKIGCPCDECGRPLTSSEVAGASAAADTKIKHQEDIVAQTEKDSVAADKALQSAVRERDAFVLTMTDLSAVSAQRASLLSKLADYNVLLREQAAKVAVAKNLRDHISELQMVHNPNTAVIADHEKELAKLETQKADTAVRLGKAYDKAAIEDAVVKVFGPTGVRARVLDEVTPFLNAQTSKYLAILSDGNLEAIWTTLVKTAKGDPREKFSIDVTNATGGKIFKSLSGGEKRKTRIATALALQDLVATRASKPIELFIGDEIDDALDPAGLERLMMILEEKARERGSVFVISHNELRDEIKQVLLVEKMPDGKTRITETVS